MVRPQFLQGLVLAGALSALAAVGNFEAYNILDKVCGELYVRDTAVGYKIPPIHKIQLCEGFRGFDFETSEGTMYVTDNGSLELHVPLPSEKKGFFKSRRLVDLDRVYEDPFCQGRPHQVYLRVDDPKKQEPYFRSAREDERELILGGTKKFRRALKESVAQIHAQDF